MEGNPIFVLDATVLIDICHGGVERETILMLERTLSPDLVCGEIEDTSMEDLVALGLVKRELLGEGIQRLQLAVQDYPGLTNKDVSALLLSVEENAVLLTGDCLLKNYAIAEQVEVHGVLWVLDQLVMLRFIDRLTAADALEAIIESDSWLPVVECTTRLKKWRSGS
jgi:hypothetical protein